MSENSTGRNEILFCCSSSFIPIAASSFNHKHNTRALTLVLMQSGSVCAGLKLLCVCVCVCVYFRVF